MVAKGIGYLMIFSIIGMMGCEVSNNQQLSSTSEENKGKVKNEPNIYVAFVSSSTNIADSSIMSGVLNIKDNCLYLNDYLLVFQTPYISWNQNPFYIKNDKQEKINIGSKVLVGGSVAKLSEISNANWLDALPKNCDTKKYWYANSIELNKS